jgi:hypothetical protein
MWVSSHVCRRQPERQGDRTIRQRPPTRASRHRRDDRPRARADIGCRLSSSYAELGKYSALLKDNAAVGCRSTSTCRGDAIRIHTLAKRRRQTDRRRHRAGSWDKRHGSADRMYGG